METKTILIVKDTIHLSFPYNLDAVNKIRDIEGRRWDKENLVWKLPATPWHCEQVIRAFGNDGFYIDPTIHKIAEGKKVKPKIHYLSGLYNFQKRGVDFILSTGGRCIIADEMGTGKTIEALSYLSEFGGRTLIVAPTNVVYKWAAEIQHWLPSKTLFIPKNGKAVLQPADYTILSYGLLPAHYDKLNSTPLDALVCDEAHYCKNYKAQRTRLVKGLVRGGIPKVLFLSGTPFQNRPAELFSLLNMLDPTSYSNFFTYAIRYCGAQRIEGGGWFFPPNGASNTSELAQRLNHIMIRRTKQDVLKELPDLTRTIVPVEITNRTAYKRAVMDVREWLRQQDRSVLNPQHVLTRMAVLRQVVGQGKLDAGVELAENILQDGKQVVLYAHHREIVSALAEALKSYRVGIIWGDTPAKERQDKINLFLMKDSELRVMICTSAGSEGIDLYTASDVIFVEREWTPAIEEQMEARLHRVGQKNAVTAWYLVALDTIDEKLSSTVQAKRRIIGSIISQNEVLETVMEGL